MLDLGLFEVRVPRTRQERITLPSGAAGFKSVPDGETVALVGISVDVAKFLGMAGHKAVRAKSGRSSIGHSALVAKVAKVVSDTREVRS